MVTVLFADLVGFTSLSERLDPEDVAVVQDEYFSGARDAVERHGGQVEKFIGDAVVATFGVPHATDDDAAQAIRAALAIVDTVATVETKLALEAGTLQVRVGVNTGEVVVVHGDSDENDWRLTGDVVNTAARLQTAAQPGTVLIGADTAFAAAHAFALESTGLVPLKGKAEPTATWRVVRERGVPSRESALRGLHAATVGREIELEKLEAARASVGDQFRTVLVLSPPGVGKTRLVTEFRNRSLAAGATVWLGGVATDGGSYGPVAQLLRHALGPMLASPDAAKLLLDRLESQTPRAELTVRHTLDLVAGERLDAEPADLWASWTAMLDSHPGDDPPVWIIEDVHLATADLRAFIRYAATTPHRTGRMVLLTARPGGLTSLDTEPFGPLQILDLEPLDAMSRATLVEDLVGEDVIPNDVIETISDASGGTPLFIEELLRSWVHSGALRRVEGDDERWEFDSTAGRLHVPSTVWAIYLGQLDALPPEPRGVVQSGSVPGTTFPSRALETLGMGGADHALDFLTMFGILAGPHEHDVDVDSYTYRHALLRDAAYATLARARRSDLHYRFAEWVVAHGQPARVAELAAHHFALAHDEAPEFGGTVSKPELAARAAEWLERAADEAIGSAPHRAAELFEHARQLTSHEHENDWGRRQFGAAEAMRRSGRLQDAMRAFAEIPTGSEAVVRAALRYEDALFASRLPRSTWGQDGMRLLHAALDQTNDDSTRARLRAALARAEIYGGNPERGAATVETALDTARANGDRGAVAHALLAQRALQQTPDHLTARLASAAELVGAARDAGDSETEIEGLRHQYVDLLEAGDIIGADAVQQRTEDLVTGLGRPLFLWYPPMWRAMRALFAGDFDAASGLIAHFLDEGMRWRYSDVDQVHAVQFLGLHADRGRAEDAVSVVMEVAARHPVRFVPVAAAALARAGRLDEAAAQLENLVLPEDQSRAYTACLTAEVVALLGDTKRSVELRRVLEPWNGHNVVLGSGAVCLGAASHYLGLLARTSGDVDGAVRLFEEAVTMNDAMAAAPAATRSRTELARTLRVLGRSDEADCVIRAAAGDVRRMCLVDLFDRLVEDGTASC